MWLSRRALWMHLTIVIVVPTFIGLFWWQVQRVRQGNTLSWAYVFEWPFFAGYAVYLWWKLVHDQPEPETRPTEAGAALEAATETAGTTSATAASGAPASTGAAGEGAVPDGGGDPTTGPEASEDDRELAAYNRYLAELDASGRRKRW